MFNWVDVILTSLSMGIDASTVNATNGIQEKNMKITKMIIISLCFGVAQTIMPIIGYFIGSTFKDSITKAIPWIAFSLLMLLAIKSFIDWIKEFRACRKNKNEETVCKECEEIRENKKITPATILVQSIATSIDALCIGFVYLSYSTMEAMLAFSIIGIITFIMSFLCVFFAKFLAKKLENWAGLIATLVFITVGLKILLQGIL